MAALGGDVVLLATDDSTINAAAGSVALSVAGGQGGGVAAGFGASVTVNEISNGVAARIDASAVMVNDHTAFRVDWMPFGGREQSGMGTGGIPYSMQELTHAKLMVIRSPLL